MVQAALRRLKNVNASKTSDITAADQLRHKSSPGTNVAYYSQATTFFSVVSNVN